ncbi:hypothetical protein KOR42_34320 [Thalassoglobus neptunius]|uniref:Uncharacterized protein n=1 Tax=Thalassoglobus neptunius TaxID=1938619 RepID=A0A5C5WNG7_9PLAN|nr:hypothetical protein KOR42_34320 [Thalassoglobus neptunius]
MKQTIAEIHGFNSKALCQWCGGNSKKECVTVSFKAGLLDEAIVCVKCLRNALRVQSMQKQPTSSKPLESAS